MKQRMQGLTETQVTTIQFFGRLQDQFGRHLQIELPSEGCTVGWLRQTLSNRAGAHADALPARLVKACVDGTMVRDDAMVRIGQDIAFMPPLSGG